MAAGRENTTAHLDGRNNKRRYGLVFEHDGPLRPSDPVIIAASCTQDGWDVGPRKFQAKEASSHLRKMRSACGSEARSYGWSRAGSRKTLLQRHLSFMDTVSLTFSYFSSYS